MQNDSQHGNQQTYTQSGDGTDKYAFVPPMQLVSNGAPQANEENLLEAERQKKHPILKSIGWTVALIGLFCMSALAGMMSDGKRPYLALFKNNFPEQHAEVKGVSVTTTQPSTQQYSGLSVTGASEVGQADPTNDNHETLPRSGSYYQYFDVLKGSQITVARQPLPDDFQGNPAGLQKLATTIGANQTFSTNRWGTAYMMSAQGAQVVAIANSKTLVFLTSTQQYSKEDWKAYIDTFQLR